MDVIKCGILDHVQLESIDAELKKHLKERLLEKIGDDKKVSELADQHPSLNTDHEIRLSNPDLSSFFKGNQPASDDKLKQQPNIDLSSYFKDNPAATKPGSDNTKDHMIHIGISHDKDNVTNDVANSSIEVSQ